MKLHLHSSLYALLLASFVSVTTVTAADINVGVFQPGSSFTTSNMKNELPSASKKMYVIAGGTELSGTDKLGYIVDGKLVEPSANTTLKYEGTGVYYRTEDAIVTPNVKVNGTLTMSGFSQAKLGGQVRMAGVRGTYDELTGIIAEGLIVKDNAYFQSHNAQLGSLTISDNAKVLLHTGKTTGNTSHILTAPQDSKQVRIESNLTVDGGFLQIATTNANKGTQDDTHCVTALGKITFTGIKYEDGVPTDASDYSISKCQISQSAGDIVMNGKSVSVGGLNIDQTGGKMDISSADYHILADYGDSTITQSGSTSVMNIGAIVTYNGYYAAVMEKLEEKGKNPDIQASLSITQTNGGIINMNRGVDFTNQRTNEASSEISKIVQQGTGGTINLAGEFKGATFDISQSAVNGKINLDGTMNAGTVEQKAGTLTVGAEGVLTVNKMKLEGGVFINNGTVNGPQASQVATLAEEGDISTTTDAEATFITIAGGEYKNFGTTNADILVDGGTLTLENGSSVGNIEMKSGSILVTNDEKTATIGSITLSGGSITFEADAQLTLQTGAVVDLGEGVEIIVMMSADELAALEGGSNVTLFDAGTNTMKFNNTLITFKDDQNNEVKATVTGNTTGGNVTVNAVVPEPTTATLSLLALAALASRRRRK